MLGCPYLYKEYGMTNEEFSKMLPSEYRGTVSDSIKSKLELVLKDKDYADGILDNLVTYGSILKEGKYKIDKYIDAVRFVSYKVMGMSSRAAYSKVFPDRYQDMVLNYAEKDMYSVISTYNKSKLVTMLYERLMIPTHILNQEVFQESINTLRDIMINPKNGTMARVQAGKALLDTLRPPEIKKMELDVKTDNTDVIAELRSATRQFAEMQFKALKGGANLEDVINAPVIIEVPSEEISR